MTGTHHYCFATDVEGPVNPRFDSDIRAYSGLEGLEELKKLGRPAASENPYLDYRVVELDTGETAYHRERRVHLQERTIAPEDAADFYAWLREQAELGVEPGVYNPADRGPENGAHDRDEDVPF